MMVLIFYVAVIPAVRSFKDYCKGGIIFMKKISQPFINKLRISNKKFDKFCDLLLSTVMNDDEKQLSFLRRLDIVASIKTSINQTK